MTPALIVLLLSAAPDPCRDDTSSWPALRHGPEEIRYLRENRSVFLALKNTGGQPVHVDVVWRELGLSGTLRVFDLTAGKDEGKVRSGFARKLPPGACAAYRIVLP